MCKDAWGGRCAKWAIFSRIHNESTPTQYIPTIHLNPHQHNTLSIHTNQTLHLAQCTLGNESLLSQVHLSQVVFLERKRSHGRGAVDASGRKRSHGRRRSGSRALLSVITLVHSSRGPFLTSTMRRRRTSVKLRA
jgi:hypothetical protein